MRKLLLTLILIVLPVLIGMMAGTCNAQTMGDEDNVSVAFAGPGYQESFNLSAGIASNVFHDVWVFKYVTVGDGFASFSSDVAVFYHFPESKWSIGAIGGIGNDWLNRANDNVSPISYLTSASGGMVNYSFSNNWGVTLHGEYTASLGSGDQFLDQYNFGLCVWSDI